MNTHQRFLLGCSLIAVAIGACMSIAFANTVGRVGSIGTMMSPPASFAPAPPPSPFYDGLTPTLYTAPTDLGTGDGSSEANAMALIDAMPVVTAGAIVGMVPANGSGSYFFPSANTDVVYFQPVSSGTAGNPITFVAKYPALNYPLSPELWSEFRATAPVFSNRALDLNANRPGIGSGTSGPDYIRWIGPYVNQAHTSVRPSHGVLKAGNGTQGVEFRKFRFDLVPVFATPSDNFNMIFMDSSQDTVVTQNSFYGGSAFGVFSNHNLAAICLYSAQNYTITANTFAGNNTSIFVKGTIGGVFNYGSIESNVFIDLMLSGIEVADSAGAPDATNIENNLFVRNGHANDETGAFVIDFSTQHAYNINFNQNTIVNPGLGGNFGQAVHVEQTNYQDFGFTNNVISYAPTVSHRGMIFGNFGGNTPSTETTSNYNLWFGAGGDIRFEDITGIYFGVPDWFTNTGHDANSTTAEPGYADPITDDYRRFGPDNGSSTGGRRGAYVTNTELIGAAPFPAIEVLTTESDVTLTTESDIDLTT